MAPAVARASTTGLQGAKEQGFTASKLPTPRRLATLPLGYSPLRLLHQALGQGRALGAQQRPQGRSPVPQHSAFPLPVDRPEVVAIEAIVGVAGSMGMLDTAAWSAWSAHLRGLLFAHTMSQGLLSFLQLLLAGAPARVHEYEHLWPCS